MLLAQRWQHKSVQDERLHHSCICTQSLRQARCAWNVPIRWLHHQRNTRVPALHHPRRLQEASTVPRGASLRRVSTTKQTVCRRWSPGRGQAALLPGCRGRQGARRSGWSGRHRRGRRLRCRAATLVRAAVAVGLRHQPNHSWKSTACSCT